MSVRGLDALYVTILCFLLLSFQLAANEDCLLSVRIEPEQQSTAAVIHNRTALSMQSYQLLQQLMNKVGCKLNPVSLPSGRAIRMLEDGELAIMVGMSKTDARSQYSYFIGPHHTERMFAVGLREFKENVADLTQLLKQDGVISVTEGAYYGEEWGRLLQEDATLYPRLFFASGNQQKLAMLASGRVIASLEDEEIIDEFLLDEELARRYSKLFLLNENPVYFAFSRKAISEERYLRLEQLWLQLVSEQASRAD